FVAHLLSRNGAVAITAAISPYRAIREEARALIGDFVEVYVSCSLDELVRRDVKGLYAKALRGEIANFTGVSDPYEPPANPEVVVDTDRETVEESAGKIIARLEELGYLDRCLPPRAVPPLPLPAVPEWVPPGERGRSSPPPIVGEGESTIAPHGGRLVDRVIPEGEEAAARERAGSLLHIALNARQLADLHMLAVGAFSPLDGFMAQGDYERAIREMRLTSGLVWSIPVTLAVEEAIADRVRPGEEVALDAPDGSLVGLLTVTERYRYDKEAEARLVYRTTDAAHPGVRALYSQGPALLAGSIRAFRRRPPEDLAGHWREPAETRAAFAQRGWRTVVGFQTRNPVHRAHEYIQKCALEVVDGLLLHPLVGETKGDDIPVDVRMRCYEVLLANYYPADRVLLSVMPAAMRYAGPREAIFHAIIRQNYGCTHFIVGRDHAGVGNYYGTYDAQHIFRELEPGDLAIQPLFFEHSFYCHACEGMASSKTCPHDATHHVVLSGTRVRAMLQAGQLPPPEFSRPEVARILVAHH
ncbi:MAG: sulfate adenylyltransferase, partial [Chloroflexi bacterium]|nr:sulfate adenylyltransferase [Chloroflexota bacterium]